MRFFLFLVILVGMAGCSHKEHGHLDDIFVSDQDFDFGIVPDTVKVLAHRFTIENPTADTCRITRVGKSCGCTKITLNRQTIPPGQSAYLDVEVDLGSNYNFFERDIKIYTDKALEPYVIFLRASRRMPKQVVTQIFPVEISENLRASTPYALMGNVCLGEISSYSFNVLNTSDRTRPLSADLVGAPDWWEVVCEDEIEANEVSRVVVTVDLSEINDLWGEQKYSLVLSSEGEACSIPVSAIFVERFSRSVCNPRIFVPTTIYSLDLAKKDEVIFTVSNIGDAPLLIRDVKMVTGSAKVSLSADEIDTGHECELYVKIQNASDGKVELGVTTNDPVEPYKILRVFCEPNHSELL